MAKPKHTSRSVAALVIAKVINGQSLSQALPNASDKLQDADLSLMRQLCYGTCRQHVFLSAILQQLLKKPLKKKDNDIQGLMLIGLYQLAFSRVPAYAALSETVSATRTLKKDWARGLVNGVLRNFQRDEEKVRQQLPDDKQQWVTPGWLLKRLRHSWPDNWQQIAQAMAEQPAMTLRVNQQHNTTLEYFKKLEKEDISASILEHIPTAIQLSSAVDVLQLPGFWDGHASIQDAGAQLAAPALQIKDGHQVLDVCAAPGGKTGHLLELASIKLWAVDAEENRLAKIKENLDRLKLTATLEVADASSTKGDWYQRQYDRILLDVPCSATGVIRRNPDIMMLRRNSDIKTLVSLQLAILDNVWPLLKSGGKLLYVTCSVLPEENARQIEAFLIKNKDAKLEDLSLPGAINAKPGQQLLPTANNDGFYYARLCKVVS